MSEKKLVFSDKLVSLLTVFLFASFFLFENYTWGKYILLGSSGIILLITIVKHKGIITFRLELWHKFILAIALFSLMSAVWGVSSNDSIQKFITTLQILITLSFLYIYYQEEDNVERLVNIVKWGGYTVGIASYYFYGINFIVLMLKTGVRLENGFSNVNSIGILCAFAIIIELYETLYYKRLKISALFCIPSLFLLLATQSRKALVLLFVGIILVLVSVSKSKNKIRTGLKLLTAVIFIFLLVYFLSKLSFFSGIIGRFKNLLDSINGEGKAGSSAVLRSQMLEVGWKYFKKYPLLGIGYGCPHVVNKQEINFDAYLHNNYIELLAGGGLVGFSLYYSIYFSLFKRIIICKNNEHFGTSICLILIVLLLISDFGMVTCYSKETYFYFMIFFLFSNELRKKTLENNQVNFKRKYYF